VDDVEVPVLSGAATRLAWKDPSLSVFQLVLWTESRE
jgi:hypothetical protein